MDPISALGFASNVVSFVDYAVKLVFEVRDVYTSATGSTEDVQTLDAIAKNLDNFLKASDPKRVQSLGLQDLTTRCQIVANLLRTAVGHLQVDGDTTVWKSFVVAFRTVRSKKETEKLRRWVVDLQSSMTLQLQKLIL